MLSRVFRLLPLLSLLAFAQDPVATARKALDLMLSEKYEEMMPLFTADMKKDAPPANLAKLGAQFKASGPAGTPGEPQVSKSGPNTIAVFPVKFGAQIINFRMVVNGAGLVMGMFPIPGGVDWQRPAYSKPDTFKEREVTVGDGEFKLPGTLTVPNGAGPFPAVVLVHGSGPNDRDETVVGTKVFKDLAEGLASRGIVVLRYEKRTKQHQTRMAGLKHLTVADETVDDAAKAAAMLRTQKEVDGTKVYMVGHSLGGYLAPRIADEDGKLAGLVLMAGNVQPIEDLVVDQVQAVGGNAGAVENAKTLQAKVKKLERGDEDGPAVGGVPPSYWIDLKDYNPAEHAKRLGIPMLILQGERDYQVTMKEFALWKTAVGTAKGVTMKSYPALNHLFVAGEGKSLPAEYAKPGHVDGAVLDDIAGFVKKQ
jgi:dienelactone hydrolase